MPRFLHYQKKCLHCSEANQDLNGFCFGCLSELEPIERAYPFEKEGESWSGFSLVKYSSLSSQVLKLCKYQGYEQLFKSLLFQLMNLQSSEESDCTFDSVTWVPVPLHWIRRRERGFNQAEVVAQVCHEVFGGEVVQGLVRPKENLSLTTQNFNDRARRSQGVFRRKGVALRNVVIVDDLITTGATLHAALSNFQVHELYPQAQFFTAFQGLGNLTSDFELEREFYDVNRSHWR